MAVGVDEAGGDQASGGVDRLCVRIDFPFDSDYPPVLDKEVKLAELTGAGIAPQPDERLDGERARGRASRRLRGSS